MFTWICPQCGAEVPPAYSECPHCKPVAPEAPKVVQPITTSFPPPPPRLAPPPPRVMANPPRPTAPPMPTAPPIAYAPPPQPVYQQPPQAPPPPQQQMQYAYPPPQRGLPAWLVTAGVFLGLAGAGYAFYTLVLNKQGASSASAATQKEEKTAAKTGRGRDLSKHLEVAGIRIHEENHKPAIRLMLVNHSGAELTQLAGTITLMTDPQNEVATIPFNLASLGAYEAKDISAPLKTKLRAYELPDWQFIKAQVKLNPSSANE